MRENEYVDEPEKDRNLIPIRADIFSIPPSHQAAKAEEAMELQASKNDGNDQNSSQHRQERRKQTD
jgi:hypothetical protein